MALRTRVTSDAITDGIHVITAFAHETRILTSHIQLYGSDLETDLNFTLSIVALLSRGRAHHHQQTHNAPEDACDQFSLHVFSLLLGRTYCPAPEEHEVGSEVRQGQ